MGVVGESCHARANFRAALYVVVRADLSPGLQMAQACHAVRDFTLTFPELDVGEDLVVLSGSTLDLERVCARAQREHMPHLGFIDRDIDDRLTAAAFSGAAKSLLRRLPLALRNPSQAAAGS